MDDLLKSLADAPLANANKINIPLGRRPMPSKSKVVHDNFVDAVDRKTAKQYRADGEAAKIKSLLDYYATTTVPFDRIAGHMKMPIGQIRESMKMRGRAK